eukprot:13447254-Heterocapsa_arctica.AAC.1
MLGLLLPPARHRSPGPRAVTDRLPACGILRAAPPRGERRHTPAGARWGSPPTLPSVLRRSQIGMQTARCPEVRAPPACRLVALAMLTLGFVSVSSGRGYAGAFYCFWPPTFMSPSPSGLCDFPLFSWSALRPCAALSLLLRFHDHRGLLSRCLRASARFAWCPRPP